MENYQESNLYSQGMPHEEQLDNEGLELYQQNLTSNQHKEYLNPMKDKEQHWYKTHHILKKVIGEERRGKHDNMNIMRTIDLEVRTAYYNRRIEYSQMVKDMNRMKLQKQRKEEMKKQQRISIDEKQQMMDILHEEWDILDIPNIHKTQMMVVFNSIKDKYFVQLFQQELNDLNSNSSLIQKLQKDFKLRNNCYKKIEIEIQKIQKADNEISNQNQYQKHSLSSKANLAHYVNKLSLFFHHLRILQLRVIEDIDHWNQHIKDLKGLNGQPVSRKQSIKQGNDSDSEDTQENRFLPYHGDLTYLQFMQKQYKELCNKLNGRLMQAFQLQKQDLLMIYAETNKIISEKISSFNHDDIEEFQQKSCLYYELYREELGIKFNSKELKQGTFNSKQFNKMATRKSITGANGQNQPDNSMISDDEIDSGNNSVSSASTYEIQLLKLDQSRIKSLLLEMVNKVDEGIWDSFYRISDLFAKFDYSEDVRFYEIKLQKQMNGLLVVNIEAQERLTIIHLSCYNAENYSKVLTQCWNFLVREFDVNEFRIQVFSCDKNAEANMDPKNTLQVFGQQNSTNNHPSNQQFKNNNFSQKSSAIKQTFQRSQTIKVNNQSNKNQIIQKAVEKGRYKLKLKALISESITGYRVFLYSMPRSQGLENIPYRPQFQGEQKCGITLKIHIFMSNQLQHVKNASKPTQMIEVDISPFIIFAFLVFIDQDLSKVGKSELAYLNEYQKQIVYLLDELNKEKRFLSTTLFSQDLSFKKYSSQESFTKDFLKTFPDQWSIQNKLHDLTNKKIRISSSSACFNLNLRYSNYQKMSKKNQPYVRINKNPETISFFNRIGSIEVFLMPTSHQRICAFVFKDNSLINSIQQGKKNMQKETRDILMNLVLNSKPEHDSLWIPFFKKEIVNSELSSFQYTFSNSITVPLKTSTSSLFLELNQPKVDKGIIFKTTDKSVIMEPPFIFGFLHLDLDAYFDGPMVAVIIQDQDIIKEA